MWTFIFYFKFCILATIQLDLIRRLWKCVCLFTFSCVLCIAKFAMNLKGYTTCIIQVNQLCHFCVWLTFSFCWWHCHLFEKWITDWLAKMLTFQARLSRKGKPWCSAEIEVSLVWALQFQRLFNLLQTYFNICTARV